MAVVLHTTQGDLPVLLKYAECPMASFNFLGLCASGYYDGCTFYRHIPGILLQTGDPTNSGKGGASVFARVPPDGDSIFPAHIAVTCGARRDFDDEGFATTSHAARGTLSMAHRGTKPNTNASQFFVLTAPQPAFDRMFTAFGVVDLSGAYDAASRMVVDCEASTSGSDTAVQKRRGEETLAALEAAAAEVDERNLVVERHLVRITGTTVLFNPFATGAVAL